MIDLHCHILPGIDDGASGIAVSLAMAKTAVGQGVEVVACTPHILPGLYHNTGPQILQATAELQEVLDKQGIPLRLVTGADVHMCPDFVAGLRSGSLLSLSGSRYVLVEPPHHAAPPQLENFFFNVIVAGYVPILTHPERLAWIASRYATIKRLVRAGTWMQVTAGSFIGAFGASAQYWAERMLDEGCIHLMASDAHDAERRPPNLTAGCDAVAKRAGAEEVQRLVQTRPMGILTDRAPSSLTGPLGVVDVETKTPLDEDQFRAGRGEVGTRGGAAGRVRGLPGRLRRLFN